jgi:hypothetical protein
MEVELGRPLDGSVFSNYVISRIWGVNEMTGAVLAFMKPSVRAMPNNRYGCGYYVHIGTRNTFTASNNPTDGDYYRGFVGAASIALVEVSSCNRNSATKEYASYPYSSWGIAVAPLIRSSRYVNNNTYEIDITFGVYGCMKTNASTKMGEVEFHLGWLPNYCTAQLQYNQSSNALRLNKPTVDINWAGLAKVGVESLLFAIDYYSTGGTMSMIVSALGGAMLFSDFVALAPHSTYNGSGVYEPDDAVWFSYTPTKNSTTISGYAYYEFESVFCIRVYADMTGRSHWNAIPIQWWIGVKDQDHSWGVWTSGDVSLVAYCSYDFWQNHQTTALFEDFSDGTTGWTCRDLNPAAGYDYWAVLDNGFSSYIVYSAGQGENSVKGGLNKDIRWYDKSMNAYMERQIDLRGYKSAHIRFLETFSYIGEGDYFAVEYYQYGQWVNSSYTAYGSRGWFEANVSVTAEKIRFRFFSDDNSATIDRGVAIACVEIVCNLPNDAGSGTDADQELARAIWVPQPGSYCGYLNGDVDCYKFTVTSQDIAQGKEIISSIQSPRYTLFETKLYNPSGTLKCETGLYILVPSDSQGNWTIKISAIRGFGPYGFRIELMTPGDGGGCPVLLVWNGSAHIDYGIINIHNAEGQDITREVSVSPEDISTEGYVAKMRLREGWEGLAYSHSSIDQVKLYIVDEWGNRHLCPLFKAIYSEQGNVLLKLLFNDDWKVDIYLKETIDLQFLVPYPPEAVHGFIFVIEGHNIEKGIT